MEFHAPLISDYLVIAVCTKSRSKNDRAINQWIIREKCKLEDFNFSSVENEKLTVPSKKLHYEVQIFWDATKLFHNSLTCLESIKNELAKLNELPLSLKVIIPQIKNYFEISTEDETILFNVSENIVMKPYLFWVKKNIYRTSVILTDKILETKIEEKTAASILNITNNEHYK